MSSVRKEQVQKTLAEQGKSVHFCFKSSLKEY
jgi:hypothetical protein